MTSIPSDASFLSLHDTLADISEIPSCSQTLSTSQISSASLEDESHQNESSSSLTPGRDYEPSSSQISDDGEGLAMAGRAKPSGSDTGSSSSSPNANPEGAADDDDSDLDLELGNWQPELPSGKKFCKVHSL